MKRRYRLLTLLFALLLVVSALASCAGEALKQEDVPPSPPDPVAIVENGESRYVIVHGATDAGGRKVAQALQSELEKRTGVELSIMDDRTAPVEGVPEILIGRTNRGIDYGLQRALRTNEWIIAREDETIYLLGDGEGVLNRASIHFLNYVMSPDFCVEAYGEIHRVSGRYNVTDLSLNDRPITDFTIWIEAKETMGFHEVLEWINERMSDISGYRLTVKEYESGEAVADAAAIVLVENAALSAADYRVDATGNCFTVSVSTKDTALALLADVIENKLPASAKGDVSLMLKPVQGRVSDGRLVALSDGADIRVMTYNVLGNVKDAMPYVNATVGAYLPDFLCTQEYYSEADAQVTSYLAQLGYGKIGGKFTCASPTAVELKDEQHSDILLHANASCSWVSQMQIIIM